MPTPTLTSTDVFTDVLLYIAKFVELCDAIFSRVLESVDLDLRSADERGHNISRQLVVARS